MFVIYAIDLLAKSFWESNKIDVVSLSSGIYKTASKIECNAKHNNGKFQKKEYQEILFVKKKVKKILLLLVSKTIIPHQESKLVFANKQKTLPGHCVSTGNNPLFYTLYHHRVTHCTNERGKYLTLFWRDHLSFHKTFDKPRYLVH